MALLNWMTDEEVKTVMKIGENCPNAESLGDQLRYGIVELHKKGHSFAGLDVIELENGTFRIFKRQYIGQLGEYTTKLLDDILSQYK